MSTPESIICFCAGVDLNNRYEHTIHWDSVDEQLNYFANKVVKRFNAYTFVRNEWTLNVHARMNEAHTWTYAYITNGDADWYRTWFYFVTKVEYVNDSTVKVWLEMDVMQSYACRYELLPCFIDRQHTTSDAIGVSLVDEGLELGELTVNSTKEIELAQLSIMILTTLDMQQIGENTDATAFGDLYDGVFSGLRVYAVAATDAEHLGTLLSTLDTAGKADAIVSMWMYPTDLITFADDAEPLSTIKRVDATKTTFDVFARPDNLDGYVPRNNKLLTYPYNQLYVSNNNGGAAVYRYEYFSDPSACRLNVVGALGSDANVKLYPINYNGAAHAYDYGLALGNYPTCAWNSDVYKMWVAQNQHSNTAAVAGAVVSAGAGALSAAISGFAMGATPAAIAMGGMSIVASGMSGLQEINRLIAQKNDMAIQPPQARGSASSSVNVSAGFQTFTVQNKCVGQGYARIIDDYFSLYGYKINRVQIPETHARANWTYVKTVGCHISAQINAADQAKIEAIFDKGITFWADPNNVGRYLDTNGKMTNGTVL